MMKREIKSFFSLFAVPFAGLFMVLWLAASIIFDRENIQETLEGMTHFMVQIDNEGE